MGSAKNSLLQIPLCLWRPSGPILGTFSLLSFSQSTILDMSFFLFYLPTCSSCELFITISWNPGEHPVHRAGAHWIGAAGRHEWDKGLHGVSQKGLKNMPLVFCPLTFSLHPGCFSFPPRRCSSHFKTGGQIHRCACLYTHTPKKTQSGSWKLTEPQCQPWDKGYLMKLGFVYATICHAFHYLRLNSFLIDTVIKISLSKMALLSRYSWDLTGE